MEDSIFTKIIKGEIPAHKIYEDDDVLAFLDIHPVTEGHTLLIPKKQVEFVWDLDAETYARLMNAAQKVAVNLREKLNVKFIGQQIIGVDVPHAHVHLIPFSQTSDFHKHPDMTAEPNHEELAELAKKLTF